MSDKNAPQVVTMGCRLNAYESEVIRENATRLGLNDAIFVNTCAVTKEAERQARQTIRKLKRENPDKKLVVTGCAAQLNPDAYYGIDGVDLVLGNREKMSPDFLDPAENNGIQVTDIMAIRDMAGHLTDGPVLKGFGSRARAFLQIQQGCDHRCTFCIIPFARGPNRSESPDRIVDQIAALVESGYPEVVLTGVDICSYGREENSAVGMTLGGLCAYILQAVPNLKRLRLSSLDPAAMDDKIFDLLAAEPRFMPHLHLSLQTASDLILKRMKRRHLVRDVDALIARARKARPDVVFGADIIAGFPTETDEHHLETLRNIDHWGIAFLHVFPYSERPGTPAAAMPAANKAVSKKRAEDIRALGQTISRKYYRSLLGQTVDLLVEQDNCGHSEHFAEITVAQDLPSACIHPVRVTALIDDRLVAERL